MYIAGSVVALISLIGLLIGLFLGVFWKGRRKQGWIVFAVSLFLELPVASGLLASDPDYRQRRENRAATEEVAVDEAAPLAEGATEVENEPAQLAAENDVPLLTEESAEPEVSVDPALAALDTPEALAVYCEGLKRYDAVYAASEEMFENNPGTTDVLETARQQANWEDEQNREITAWLTEELGVPFEKWMVHANSDGWNRRCDAVDKDWEQVWLTDVQAASRDDQRRVRDAIELNYIRRLQANEGNVYFDQNYFSVVECRTRQFAGLEVIGCRMRGGFAAGQRDRSDTMFYFAATLNGSPIIVPIDSTAEDHMRWPSIPGVDSQQIAIGKYLGPYPIPGLDWAAVKGYFNG